jgi:hypothetical protein
MMYAMSKDLARLMDKATELIRLHQQGSIAVLRSSFYDGVRASLTPPMPTDPPVIIYCLHPARCPRPAGSWSLIATVRERPWQTYRLEEVRALAEAIDVEGDPKDIRRGMLTQEERDLYALLPPSTVLWLLDQAGVPRKEK